MPMLFFAISCMMSGVNVHQTPLVVLNAHSHSRVQLGGCQADGFVDWELFMINFTLPENDVLVSLLLVELSRRC